MVKQGVIKRTPYSSRVDLTLVPCKVPLRNTHGHYHIANGNNKVSSPRRKEGKKRVMKATCEQSSMHMCHKFKVSYLLPTVMNVSTYQNKQNNKYHPQFSVKSSNSHVRTEMVKPDKFNGNSCVTIFPKDAR